MSEVEEWRPVVGYEGLYEVSSLGRVRSISRQVTQRISGGATRTRTYAGRMKKVHVAGNGYLTTSLCRAGSNRPVSVHVLVAEAFLGPRPPQHVVAHNDGNPRNGTLENLRYATYRENMADCWKHGTRGGSRQPATKYSDETVRKIRTAIGTCRAVADRFGCSPMHVNRIRRGLVRPA